MKPHFLPLLLAFSFISYTGSSQYIPMVEEGKFWIYLNCMDIDHPQPASGHAITIQGDTVINSISYKKVYRHQLKGRHNCQFPPCFQFDLPYQIESTDLISFIREDTVSKKVFNLPILQYEFFCEADEHLIFDFSFAVGDTINSCIYKFIGAEDEDFFPFGLVDSIKATERFGRSRTTIFTTGIQQYGGLPPEGEVLIVEGVGLEWYGLFHAPIIYLVDYCEGGMEHCQIISSAAPIVTNQEVSVYPNPTTGICEVSLEEEDVERIMVYSTMGVYITETFNTNQIDLSPMEGGIYFLEIVSENGERIVKKVIKEK